MSAKTKKTAAPDLLAALKQAAFCLDSVAIMQGNPEVAKYAAAAHAAIAAEERKDDQGRVIGVYG